MSTASRLFSGSAASWVRIITNMVFQMALVPLFLTHWSVETYGTWLAIQALVNILSTLDQGHQNYIAYEFLKIGKNNLDKLSLYFSSSVFIGIMNGLLQVIVISICIYAGIIPYLLGGHSLKDVIIVKQAGGVLLLQGLAGLLTTSVGGLLVRVLAPFGYYPRMSWWGVVSSILAGVGPAIAVSLGANLLIAGIISFGCTIGVNIFQHWDMFVLFKKEKLRLLKPQFKLGYKNFLNSLVLSGKGVLENLRQQGVRLILAPLSGAAGLAAFSTMRTGANVALQGLNTIINPLEPELMRFLHQRDQARSEAAFGTVWIVVVALMAPSMVILQTFIEPLYTLWTKGSIQFNPLLFSLLSLDVLIYAVAQPSIAVVIGNNLLKPQIILSIISTSIVVGGMFILVPYMGILGAGIAIVFAEIALAIGYRFVAMRWLDNNGLAWPVKSSLIAVQSVVIAAISMILLSCIPTLKLVICLGALALLFLNFRRYWQSLPKVATDQAFGVINKLPIVKRIIKFQV